MNIDDVQIIGIDTGNLGNLNKKILFCNIVSNKLQISQVEARFLEQIGISTYDYGDMLANFLWNGVPKCCTCRNDSIYIVVMLHFSVLFYRNWILFKNKLVKNKYSDLLDTIKTTRNKYKNHIDLLRDKY
ncbi:hypothetical protein ACJX0J_015571, partial [Zea mays]